MDVANDEHTKTMTDEPPKRGSAAGKLIDPLPEDVVLVTYPDTLDGFLAAWVVRKMAREKNVPLEMATAPPPDIDLSGRNWIMIGDAAQEVASQPKSGLRIRTRSDDTNLVDPLPFNDWKRTLPFGIETMVKRGVWAQVSGTSLSRAAWEFFHPGREGFDRLPRMIDYVNDSLTVNRYGDTPDVVACIESYHRQFVTYDKLVEACDDRKRLAYVIAGGQAVRRFIEKTGTSFVSVGK
jgi:hypothetical protein